MNEGRGIKRLLTEGVVIVLSILLAFAIDAWWDGLGDTQRIVDQTEQLVLQLSQNQAVLQRSTEQAQRSLAAADAVVMTVGPRPNRISADSLALILESALRMDAVEVETGAVEALLTQGELGASVDAALQPLLVVYRTAADGYEREGERFQDAREDVVDYLVEVAPFPYLFGYRDPVADFGFPVDALLVDGKLESLYTILRIRGGRLTRQADTLTQAGDSLLAGLARR